MALGCCCCCGHDPNDVAPFRGPDGKDAQTPSPDGATTGQVAGNVCSIFGPFFALFVRIVLGAWSLFIVYLVVLKKDNSLYWLMTLPLLLMVAEGIYTILKRGGQERKWICLCFVFYLMTSVPPIWVLEIDKIEEWDSLNKTSVSGEASAANLNVKVELDPDVEMSIAEQSLVFLLILCRWLLPRGKISRNQLSSLLFVFIGMASDIMEFLQLFEEDAVRERMLVVYIILTVWSVSLIQFCFVLTMVQSPKKARVALDTTMDTADIMADIASEKQRCTVFNFFIRTEIWSLFVSILMQDGPFLGVRLYTMISLGVMNYSIVFFVAKNILVITLLLYRLIVLSVEWAEASKEQGETEAPSDRTGTNDPRKTRKELENQPEPSVSTVDTVIDNNMTVEDAEINESADQVVTEQPGQPDETSSQDSGGW